LVVELLESLETVKKPKTVVVPVALTVVDGFPWGSFLGGKYSEETLEVWVVEP